MQSLLLLLVLSFGHDYLKAVRLLKLIINLSAEVLGCCILKFAADTMQYHCIESPVIIS